MLDRAFLAIQEGRARGSEMSAVRWLARLPGEDVGACCGAQIRDQAIEAGVADTEPIDIDHRFDQAH